MKKIRVFYRLGLCLMLMLSVGFFPQGKAAFAETDGKAAEILDMALSESGQRLNEEQKLYDLCGTFSAKEAEEITERISKQEAGSGISIRVFVAKMRQFYEKEFLEECADRLCDGGYASEDLAIMLLNLDEDDRGVCIQGYGLCESRLNDDRIEYILDDIITFFGKEDFVYGTKLFATEAAYYANSTDYGTYYSDRSFEGKMKQMPWFFLVVISAVVAVVGILLMKWTAGGRMTVNDKTYMQSDKSGLTAKRDDFIRTSVTKTYSPRSSGSSSGGGSRSSGGGGRSSGVRSHSGGSRRF